ncbi:MAG: hypothetical protein R3E12_11380 [Candidatus Eisenbacteria bacterium]
MIDALAERLERAFHLTHDLVSHLDEAALRLDLPDLPSNRLADQLWCIVGARESYAKAIRAGGWQGFSCSLESPESKDAVLAALEVAHRRVREIDFADLSDLQVRFAFDLLEHEMQHHGQLIRFVYGNRLTFPRSWSERYTV